MKRINLFFMSLLACLLVGTNAWGQTADLVASTIYPSQGAPEHQYYIHIANGSNTGYYWGSNTVPTNDASAKAKYAFYAVPGVEHAYHIYSVTDGKWVSYTLSSGYSNCNDFVSMTGARQSKDKNYYDIRTATTKSSTTCYQIRPYNTGGVAGKWINWYKGVTTAAGKKIGLWQESPSQDDGSGWSLEAVDASGEVELGIQMTNKILEAQDLIYTSTGKLYTAASQFDNHFGHSSEGAHPEYLIDGNLNTMWHSNWATSVAAGTHYAGVNTGATNLSEFYFSVSRRLVDGDQFTSFSVYAVPTGKESDYNKDNLVLLKSGISMPVESQNEVFESPFINAQGYNNFRIYCDGTGKLNSGGSGRGYFHMAELQLYGYTISSTSTKVTNLQTAIKTARSAEATAVNIATLQSAIDAYKNSQIKYVLTDNAGNEYQGMYDAEAYTVPTIGGDNTTITGAKGATLSGGTWNDDGTIYTATVNFPFSISKEGGETTAVTIQSYKEYTDTFYWFADGTEDVAVQKNVALTSTGNQDDFRWAIYPKLTSNKFTFNIKNLAKNKYLYTTSTSKAHTQGTVTLKDTKTDFTFESDNQWKIASGSLYLSKNSSTSDSKEWLGTYSSHNGTKTTITDVPTYEITYNYVYTGTIFTTLQGEHFKTETIAKAMDYKAAPTYFGLNVTKEVSTDGGTTYTTLADNATPSANCIVRFSYVEVNDYPFVPTTIEGGEFASGTKYYKMKLNGKYGKYNSTDNCVDNVSEVDENNATLFQFAFVGDPVNGYTIYNKERGTSKKFYENSPGNGGAAITFIDSPNGYWTMGASTASGGGYWLKETSGTNSYLNDRGSKFSFWIATAAESGTGSRIFFEIYDIAAYAADLQATIDAVSEYPTTTTGQTGYYTKSTLDGFIETAQTALADENRTCATLAAAKKTLLADAETAVVYPVLEGYYQWISALEFTAGEMDIYVDGTNLKWHGRDNTDMTSYWEVMKIEDGKYTFKNEASAVYPTAITNDTQSQATVSETENAMILTHLVGTNAWALSPDGSSIDKKYFHCYGHGNGSGTSGQIIGYYTGGASNWILEQVDDPELSVEKAKLQTRVEELEAISTNNLWGTNPGYYPAGKQSTVEAAVVTAKETLNSGSKIASAYTTALTTLNSTIGADFGIIMPTPGAYYRLHQVGQGRYAYAKANNLNSVKPLKTTDTDTYKKGTSAIIKFEDGGSGYYNLKTFNGKYVQAASKSTHVKLETSSVLYNVYSPKNASFLLSNDKAQFTNLHSNSEAEDATVVGWEDGTSNATRWYIEPVTDFTPYNVAYAGLGDGITVTSVTYTEPVTEEALVISTDGFIALQNGVANPTATNFAAVCSNEYWKVGSVSVEDGTITLNFIYDEVAEKRATLLPLLNKFEPIINNNLIGTGVGYYTVTDANFATAVSEARSAYDNASSTAETLQGHIETLSGMESKVTLNVPQAGHFYTIAATGKQSYYMRSTASTAEGYTTRLAWNNDEVTQHNNVFYYNDGKLQGYTEGKYVSKLDDKYNAGPGETGAAMSFEHKAGTTSFYLKIDDTNYLYANNGKKYISSATSTSGGDNMTWELVDVTNNIYNVSFTPTGLTGASVIITDSEDRAATETTPWIYSADAISAANLTFGTVTNYAGSAEISNKSIAVTYTPSLAEGLYWFDIYDNTVQKYLTYDGSTYSRVEGANRVAGSIFYVNGTTVKAQGKDVSKNFEYKTDPFGTLKMYFNGEGFSVTEATGLKIDLNSTTSNPNRKYATFCAPFAIEIGDTLDAYNAAVNTNTGVITLTRITTSNKVVDAGVPVLIHCKNWSYASTTASLNTKYGVFYQDAPIDDDTSTAFKGSFVKTSFAELTGNNYVLGASNGVIGFYKMKENANLRANSAYVQIPSTPSQDGNAKGFSISFEDDPTTIYELVDGQLVEKDAPIYNLGGQKISKLQKGINIVNGKKVLY